MGNVMIPTNTTYTSIYGCQPPKVKFIILPKMGYKSFVGFSTLFTV